MNMKVKYAGPSLNRVERTWVHYAVLITLTLLMYHLIILFFHEKEMNREEFLQRLKIEFHEHRSPKSFHGATLLLRDTVCDKDKCLQVWDSLGGILGSTVSVERQLMEEGDTGGIISDARLEMPRVLVPSALDTTNWEVNHYRTPTIGYFGATTQNAYRVFSNSVTEPLNVLIIGLGPGALPSHFQVAANWNITVVELDPMMLEIGQKWFGLRPSSRLHVHIGDGAEFVKEEAQRGVKYDLILQDACDNNMKGKHKMICPVDVFLQDETIDNLAKIVAPGGFFEANTEVNVHMLTSLKEEKRLAGESLQKHEKHFAECFLQKIFGYVNKILVCAHDRNVISTLPDGY